MRTTGYGPSVVVLVTAGAILLLGPTAIREISHARTEVQVRLASERLADSSVLEELNRSFRDIALMVEPSVVHISAVQRRPGGRPSLSKGSGWIYDDAGHIVTNHHVVANHERIEVQLSTGQLREARFVGSDPSTDIAVLEIDPEHSIAATRGDAGDPVQQGDMVFAFGSPFDFKFSMSAGVVSGKGRSVGVIRDRGRDGYESFIQVDAAINPGNSGGPLTDHRGHVVGMNTAIATTGGAGSPDEGQFAGIGLAIPLEMIEPVVDQLIDKGYVSKGFLGVNVANLSPRDRAQFDWDGDGVRVARVVPGTAAERAGLEINDLVTAIDGESVQTDGQLTAWISSKLPGQEITLSVQRPDPSTGDLEPLELIVRLDELDPLLVRGELPANQSREAIEALGIASMASATPELAARYGIEFREGVMLLDYVDGTDLDLMLDPGSILVSVLGIDVGGVDDFIETLRRFDLSPIRGTRVYARVHRPDGEEVVIWLRDQRGVR